MRHLILNIKASKQVTGIKGDTTRKIARHTGHFTRHTAFCQGRRPKRFITLTFSYIVIFVILFYNNKNYYQLDRKYSLNSYNRSNRKCYIRKQCAEGAKGDIRAVLLFNGPTMKLYNTKQITNERKTD